MVSKAKMFDEGETMAEMWHGYAGLCIPHVRNDSIQYAEMEKAFYSGGLALFNWLTTQMDDGDEATDADLDRMSNMRTELMGFLMDAILKKPPEGGKQ